MRCCEPMLRATEQSKDKLSIFRTYSLISIVSTVSWYTGWCLQMLPHSHFLKPQTEGISQNTFFLSFFFLLLVSFCKCLYVHLYIQKTIWNRFKMWKIFSEIKMWCNPKRKKDLSVFYHNFFWILITRWDHRDLDGWHNILAEPSILCPSPHFHPHVFPSLSSLPSPAFISSDTTYPGLDFRLKTKHGLRGGQKKHPRTQREGGPQANWQLGVKVSLSPPCSYSFTLFLPCFCPFVFFSEHRLLRKSWTSVHTAVCWNEEKINLRADWKLSKLTVPCKTAQHTHSKSEH